MPNLFDSLRDEASVRHLLAEASLRFLRDKGFIPTGLAAARAEGGAALNQALFGTSDYRPWPPTPAAPTPLGRRLRNLFRSGPAPAVPEAGTLTVAPETPFMPDPQDRALEAQSPGPSAVYIGPMQEEPEPAPVQEEIVPDPSAPAARPTAVGGPFLSSENAVLVPSTPAAAISEPVIAPPASPAEEGSPAVPDQSMFAPLHSAPPGAGAPPSPLLDENFLKTMNKVAAQLMVMISNRDTLPRIVAQELGIEERVLDDMLAGKADVSLVTLFAVIRHLGGTGFRLQVSYPNQPAGPLQTGR